MIKWIALAWRWWTTPGYLVAAIGLVFGILLLSYSKHAFVTVTGWMYVGLAVAQAVMVYKIRKWERELDEQS